MYFTPGWLRILGALADSDIVFGYVGSVVLGVGYSWVRDLDCGDVPLAYNDPEWISAYWVTRTQARMKLLPKKYVRQGQGSRKEKIV